MSETTPSELRLAGEPADEVLAYLGYTALEPSVVDAERPGLTEPLLVKRLEQALRRLNPWLSNENLARAIRYVGADLAALDLEKAAERAHSALVGHVAVEQEHKGVRQSRTVQFLDFENPVRNDFSFTYQYRMQGAKNEILADLVIFVNGIPLAVIEFGSPVAHTPEDGCIERLLRYQELGEHHRLKGAPRLFTTVQAVVATNGLAVRYATVGTPASRWAEWKVPYPRTIDELSGELGRSATPQDILLAGLFRRENLLDLVRNFTVFELHKGSERRSIAHYHQYVAVNEAIARVRMGRTPLERGGVLCHTWGSGRILTMQFLASKLRSLPEADNPLIILVFDRAERSEQAMAAFHRRGFPSPKLADSMTDLYQLVLEGSGRTVVTTIQKFQGLTHAPERTLTQAHNVFVVVDDAHRTQHGNLAMSMRAALPNATYIAFTSTPIEQDVRNIRDVFGDYIHTYTISQAVVDGALVPIYYEAGHEHGLTEGDSGNDVFDQSTGGFRPEDQERIKRQHAAREVRASAPDRIERICGELLSHYRLAIQPNGFKGQVIAPSREAAVLYKETLDQLGAPESALLISVKPSDPEHLLRWQLSSAEQRNLLGRFQDPGDPLVLLIVCDMHRGGLDVPVVQVLYLDAPLREHALLQAISCVSRVAEGKNYGLVVDYWGVFTHLEKSLATLSSSDVSRALRPKSTVRATLDARRRTSMRFFQTVDRSNPEACLQLLKEENVRAEFDLAFRRFAQGINIFWPDPDAHQFLQALRWLAGIRAMAHAHFRDEQLNLQNLQPKVRLLIEEHTRPQHQEPSIEARTSLTRDESKELGLDEPGYAIYLLLEQVKQRPGAVPHPAQESRDLAQTILDELKPLLIVDWTQKEEVKRKMRATIKAWLRQTGFSRDDTDALVPRMMDEVQARLAR